MVESLRIVALSSISPNMVLGRDIRDSEGRVLLAAGASLGPRYLERLAEFGITFVYVDDGRYGEIEIEEVVAEETRVEAMREVKQVMSRVQRGQDFAVRRMTELVNEILDELTSNPGTLLQMTEMRAMTDYTFAHSVAVAVSSLVTGVAMGYDRRQLMALGTGALLHDVGKCLLPDALVNKRETLTPQEVLDLRRHPLIGYEALVKRDELSPLSAHIAYQHHERLNGGGYPRGLKGSEIHEFARLVAIADVFDAMTTDRVYRRRHLPHEAVEFLTTGAGLLFDPDMVNLFVENIALYPAGTIVRLSDQRVGVVVKNRKAFPTRPVVRVTQPEGDGRSVLRDIDLTRELTVFIVAVLTEEPLAGA